MNFTDEQRNVIFSQVLIIAVIGVAGCGKTKTLIERIINQKSSNILIIARTNSVVDEITKRLKIHNIILTQINSSKHYTYKAENGKYISIATIDAFIDHQLRVYEKSSDDNFKKKWRDLVGNNFSGKKKLFNDLCIENKIKKLYIKNNEGSDIEVDQIHIDEVQDMTPIELNQFIYILNNNKKLGCSVYGDTFQTLTEESTKKYPILTFIYKLNAKPFFLSICFRCPRGHVDYNNCLLGNERNSGKFGDMPAMKSNNDNTSDRPFPFSHPGINKNSSGLKLAKIIITIIEKVLEEDKNIGIQDCVILAPRINDCSALQRLVDILNKHFKDKFHYFETKDGEQTIPINFELIKESYCDCTIKSGKKKGEKKPFSKGKNYCNKCNKNRENIKGCIISINGFKGREAPLVISLNLAEKSIPKENHIGKNVELTDLSLLNVLTTRSTKYYFCGINETSPSSYFMNKKNELYENKLCYHPWFLNKIDSEENPVKKRELQEKHDNLFKNAPEIYIKIAKELRNNSEPVCINYNKLNTPDKDIIDVTSISQKICIEDIITERDYEITEEIYGISCKFSKEYDSRILGKMVEVLIWRKLYINNKIEQDNSNIEIILNYIYYDRLLKVENEEDYGIITDLECNNTITKNENISKDEYYDILDAILKDLSPNSKLPDEIKRLFTTKKQVVFCYKDFFNKINEIDINKFLDKKIENEEIDSKIYMNIAIILDHLTNKIFRIHLVDFIDTFNEDIKHLHSNVNNTVRKLNFCRLEIPIKISHREKDPKILKKLGYNIMEYHEIFEYGYNCSIVGRTDIVEVNNNLVNKNLTEIKASESDNCNNTWIIQVILYATLNYLVNNSNYSNIVVNNILAGKQYSINFTINKKIGMEIIEKILDKYNFIPELKNNFIKSKCIIQNHNEYDSDSENYEYNEYC